MIDCGNSEIRELLPDMLHDSLSPADRQRVAAHMLSCAPCRAEYELLSKVYSLGKAPAVNVSAIVASITPYRRRPWMSVPPLMRIAASIGIIAVGGLSYSIVNNATRMNGVDTTGAVVISNDTTLPATSTGSDNIASSDLNSLDDQALQELLAELEKLEATIPVETRPLVRNPRASGN